MLDLINYSPTTGRHFLYHLMQLTHRCKIFTHFTTRMCVWLLYHLFSSWVDRQRDISRTFTQILALKFIKLCFCQIPGVPFAWVSDVLFDWYIKPISTTLPCINYNCSIRIYEAVAITENGKAEEWQHLFYMSVCLLCSVNIPSSLNWILIIKIMNYISTMNKLWIDRIICNYL